MTFDSAELYDVLGDIETYLGYLKANELAFEYLREASAATTGTPIDDDERTTTVWLDEGYRFPCPEQRFAVKPTKVPFNVHIPASSEHGTPETSPTEWIHLVQDGADQSYRNGIGWASGLQVYTSSLVDEIVKPDAVALDASATELRTRVVEVLTGLVATDWAKLNTLLGNWHGDAKLGFGLFYDGVGTQLYDFTRYTAYAYRATCAATRIIDQSQTGLMSYARNARQAIINQLDEWADLGRPPTDPPKTPQWLARLEKIGADSIGLLENIPVVKDVVAQGQAALSIKESLTNIAVDLGAEPPHDEPPFDARDSAELYDEIMDALKIDFHDKFHAVMDSKFKTKPSIWPPGGRDLGETAPTNAAEILTQLRETMKQGNWDLPSVSDGSVIATTNPDYDRDHNGVDDDAKPKA